MDPETRPANQGVEAELEQQGDREPENGTAQGRVRGADEAASTSGGEG